MVALLSGGCVVGPDYKKPATVTPPDWKLAEPSDGALKGDWWRLFQDPVLNDLETEAGNSNRLIQVAMARVDQSRAIARLPESRLFPQLAFDPSVTSFRTPPDHVPARLSATAYTTPLDFSYEVDLWGKIRRSFESARAQTQATEADYCNVLLTLHGDVAANYFLLRQLDEQIDLLQQTVQLREKSVRLLDERFHAELSPELDLERARTELAQAKTLMLESQRQRDDLQNAIALLCGQPASAFQIKPGRIIAVLPDIPAGLPSQLLERRPDVSEAERKMAAANAQIGVAKAAFFPAISLTGNAGYSSFHASSLLNWDSRLFQIGPAVTMPILNGSRLQSELKAADAGYQAACGSYQQQVLTAFKDVSDSLTDLDSQRRQAGTEAGAITAAGHAASLSHERYDHGLTSYLDVLDSERTQLQTQIQMVQIRAAELVSTVRLIKALGGGFDSAALDRESTQSAGR